MRSLWAILTFFVLNWPHANGKVVLQSPRITNWGTWHPMKHCPANTYATGMQIKNEVYQGNGDDSGLNEVVFYCQPLNRTGAPKNIWITGGVGPKGIWLPVQWCPQGQVIIGFALRSEPDYGSTADDFAAVNILALCGYAYGPRNEYNRIQSETIEYGTRSPNQFCPIGSVACGIQTQIQPTHSGDNTALNNVNVACCVVSDSGNTYFRPPSDHALLLSPRVTNSGRWYNMEHCPENHYATGMQIRNEKYQGNADDSGLNGVALYCQPLNTPSAPKNKWITGAHGQRGDWLPIHWCPQGQSIIGFTLRSDKWYTTGDNFGAVNFTAYCGYPYGPRKPHHRMQNETIEYGEWTADQFCPEGFVVCGIQAQVWPAHKEDNTALHNVNVDCCKIALVPRFVPISTSRPFSSDVSTDHK